MKSVLKLIISHFLVIFLGCLIGTLIVGEFLTTMQFVIGERQSFFAPEIWLKSFFLIIPAILLICPMMMSFYAARHQTHRMTNAITYTVLCCISWLVLFPCYLICLNKFSQNIAVSEIVAVTETEKPDPHLSEGYFRKLDNRIYYTVQDSSPGSAVTEKIDAAAIYTDGVSIEDMFSSVSGVNIALAEVSQPFSDILVKNAITFDFLPVLVGGYKNMLRTSLSSWNAGKLSWLFFAFFGFALSGVYIFIDMSSWKIVNSILVAFVSCLIIFVNCAYFYSFYQKFENLNLPAIFSSIDNAPLVLLNFFVGVVFAFIGIVTAIVRAANARN